MRRTRQVEVKSRIVGAHGALMDHRLHLEVVAQAAHQMRNLRLHLIRSHQIRAPPRAGRKQALHMEAAAQEHIHPVEEAEAR